MNFEIDLGLETVNSRCGTDYTSPDEVIVGAAELADKMLNNENVDYEFDSHIMALDLFRAGGVIRPLRSEVIIKASQIWLSKNEVI